MPRIIEKGEPIDKPQCRKWAGANGAKESEPLRCPFCKTIFVLKKHDPVWERADCFNEHGIVVRYFVQCPSCRHRTNHERAAIESNAA